MSPGGGRYGASPYIKISTNDQGIIKIVDGAENLYKSNAVENATIIFTEVYVSEKGIFIETDKIIYISVFIKELETDKFKEAKW